jgi:hypothetical protein
MNKILAGLAVLVIAGGLAYAFWPAAPAAPDAAPDASSSTAPGPVTPAATRRSGDSREPAELDTEAAMQAVRKAESMAAEGQVDQAMATLAPHAAAGDAESVELLGTLNILRHEDQRRERVAFLVQQLSRAPEDATAQRFAILRELSRLAPNDQDFAELRELYGELFVDELEAGLLKQ